MNRQRNVLLALFGWLSLFVLMANGQQAEVVTKITDEELEVMSDQELELICIERGFELIQDEMEDGDLTHEDYVDAAKRCLAIEEDM